MNDPVGDDNFDHDSYVRVSANTPVPGVCGKIFAVRSKEKRI